MPECKEEQQVSAAKCHDSHIIDPPDEGRTGTLKSAVLPPADMSTLRRNTLQNFYVGVMGFSEDSPDTC